MTRRLKVTALFNFEKLIGNGPRDFDVEGAVVVAHLNKNKIVWLLMVLSVGKQLRIDGHFSVRKSGLYPGIFF